MSRPLRPKNNADLAPDLFKQVMRHHPEAVTIATCFNTTQEPIGVTIGSFATVSLAPPLVLFSLCKQASVYRAFMQAQAITINLLSHDQQDLSASFAHKTTRHWDPAAWDFEASAPRLKAALGVLESIPWARYDGGDHTIFVLKVLEAAARDDKSPLVYYNRGYCVLG